MFKRLPISFKIGLIAAIGLVGFAIYQAVNYRLSVDIRDRLAYLIEDEFQVLQFSNYLQINFNQLDELYQAALAEADLDTLDEANQQAKNIENEFAYVQARYQLPAEEFNQLQSSFTQYQRSIASHTRRVIENELNYDQIIAGYDSIYTQREQYLKLQKSFLNNRYQSFDSQLQTINDDEKFIVEFGLILGLILFLVLGLFSLLIIQRVVTAFQNAVEFAHAIAAGDLDASLQTKARDETGQLVQSLNSMRFVLKRENQHRLQREAAQLFLTGLDDSMRGDPGVDQLIENVCEYLQASISKIHAMSFYLRVDEDSLVLQQQSGVDQILSFDQVINLDEGKAGEAAIEKQAIQYFGLYDRQDDEADELLSDTSIHEKPAHWLIFPILLDQELVAQLVFSAADSSVTNKLKVLLLQANNSIAVAINSAQTRKKVAFMLEQTQQQAKELQRQRYELGVINDQLEDKTRDLDRQKSEVLEKNELLEASQIELLDKSKALELSGKYKSQFLSIMSHELRTPLNSILLLSDALLENRDRQLSNEEVKHAQVIHNAGEELLNLINDILDLSKVEEGKMDVVFDTLKPIDIANELTMQFEILANNKNLSFSCQVQATAPEVIYTDKHRLFQILKNFISNAFKFTEYGSVTVVIDKASDEDLLKMLDSDGLDRDHEFVSFNVVDTGIGIPLDKQSIVFDAFKQADGTTSRKFGGTGLGLTISKELALLLGGSVSLSSAGIGSGSEFAVAIPVGSANAMLQQEQSVKVSLLDQADSGYLATDLIQRFPLPESLPSETILYVCDSQHRLDLIETLLADFPLKLVIKNKADALLAFLAKVRPIAIVVEGDCPALIEALLKLDDLPPVFSIACSHAELNQLALQTYRYCNPASFESIFDHLLLSKPGSPARTLFIEDNAVFHEVIRSVFAKQGLSVDIVTSAEQSLQMLYQQSYELVIVDLNLPDFSGLDIIRVIRSMPVYLDKHIALFTAEDLLADKRRVLLSYADEIIVKSPHGVQDIAVQAKQLIKQRRLATYSTSSDMAQSLSSGDILAQKSLQDKTILLVDDDTRNLYSMSTTLQSQGVRVFQASNGKAALDILMAETSIELVLLDIMMPDMDGYEVLKHLRNSPSLANIPVIALTAKAMLGDRQKCLDAGATDYLSKPVLVKQLFNRIHMHLV